MPIANVSTQSNQVKSQTPAAEGSALLYDIAYARIKASGGKVAVATVALTAAEAIAIRDAVLTDGDDYTLSDIGKD